MAKTYRTANGGKVDLGALILSNENTRATGNMGVNARGDKVNSNNEVIETRNEQIQRTYDMAVNNQPVDELPPTSIKHAKKLEKERAIIEKREANPSAVKQRPTKADLRKIKKDLPKATKDPLPVKEKESLPSAVDDAAEVMSRPEKVVQPAQTLKKVPQGGLAAAIAKAKEIKEEPEKTARQMQQEQKGVKRI
jgi:hypothetical protein